MEVIKTGPISNSEGLTKRRESIPHGKKATTYDPLLPRKVTASILGISPNTVMKLESEGVLTPIRKKYGAVDVVMHRASELSKAFKYRKESFKHKEEAEVIAVFSQKGGVGKSSITQQLGSIMSLVGRVLIIDLDAQGDATLLFGIEEEHTDLVDKDDEHHTVA
ncbi:MAG: AAA family ATPase, partial [Ekhidna sp.]|nr:AAA family ATPase [Ekhidna sp.]